MRLLRQRAPVSRGVGLRSLLPKCVIWRSAASAKEIRILIDESVHQVKGGVQQINDVNKTLSDIVEGIRDLAGSINQISLASVEQSNGLNQISEALRNLDEITQSNGQMAEQAKYVAISLEERA